MPHRSTTEVWTFVRDRELLHLRRRQTDDGFVLVETQDGHLDRTYYFTDFQALEAYQDTLQQLLIRDGWRLDGYRRDAPGG